LSSLLFVLVRFVLFGLVLLRGPNVLFLEIRHDLVIYMI